jgi:hypothetical protein
MREAGVTVVDVDYRLCPGTYCVPFSLRRMKHLLTP